MQLSVIIPAYNAEKYIERCLKSVLTQDIDENLFEVIVVNDGSPDNLEQKVFELQKQHKNLVYIKQKNQKQGAARNAGLKIARGEYITFVDSDDFVNHSNSFSTLLKLSVNNGVKVDIVQSSKTLHIQQNIATKFSSEKIDFPTQIECYNFDDYIKNKRVSFAAWGKLYKKSMLLDNEIFFREKCFFEDNDFPTKAMSKAQNIVFANMSFYVYCNSPQSTTTTYKKEYLQDFIIGIKELENLILSLDNISKQSRNKLIYAKMNLTLSLARRSRNFKVKDSLECFKLVKKLGLLNTKNNNLTGAGKLKFYLLRKAPLLVILTTKVFR